jgi:multiple sugar transport system permease protein
MSNEPGRSAKLYDELLAEEAGASQAAEAAPSVLPVLPRMRLTMQSKAPLFVKKKAAPGGEALPASASLLPDILKQVDQALRAPAPPKPPSSAAPSRAAEKMAAASGQAPAAPVSAAPVGKDFSRRALQFRRSYGKPHERVWARRKEIAEDLLEDRAIYTVRGSETALRVPERFYEKPGWAAWAFLLPALAAFMLFSWAPLLRGFILSFQHLSLGGGSQWVGFDNYLRAAQDPQVWATVGHAVLFCGLSLALGFWLPVGLALYANELRRGQGLLKLVFFLPFLTPAVPAVVLWRWIFDQGYGLLNSLVSLLPFVKDPHIPWLNEPTLAMLSVVVVFLWKNTGWNALIYLTAVKDVPEELYETAELDGAPLRTRIAQVSLPYLRGTMRFLLLMQIIATFQVFTEVYLLTAGGPMNSTEMIATYMYKKSFLYLDIGYASALAVVLFLGLLSFTSLRLKAMEEEA